MLRFSLFAGLRGGVGGAIRFNGPTSQQQPDNDTENQLFLFGQAVHAGQYRGGLDGSQWLKECET